MKLFKSILIFLLVFLALSGCSNEKGTSSGESYEPAELELTFPNSAGEPTSLAPDGKTLYLYFTGIN